MDETRVHMYGSCPSTDRRLRIKRHGIGDPALRAGERTDGRTIGRRWMEAAPACKITPHQKTWKTEKRHVKTESELCSLLLPQIRILATFSPGYFFSKKLVDKNLIIVPKLENFGDFKMFYTCNTF